MLVFCLLLAQSQLVTTSGYVDSRTTAAATQTDGTPGLTELAEANAQIKLSPHQKVTLFTDTSVFWQGAWLIRGGDKDLAQYRPSVVINEMYADLALQEHFRLVIGKKRIVWGSGLSFNPTDVLNPPKDPTDPTFQRAGAWLAEAEFGFEKVALSVIAAGKVLRSYAGLPTSLIVYPDHPSAEAVRGTAVDDRDSQAHYAMTARLYLLLADIDVNLIYAYTNLYNDAFTARSKVGLSLSRVFGNLEVHGEAMAFTGSARPTVHGTTFTRDDLQSTSLNAQALIGARYQFDSNSTFGAEYYFNGEGLEGAAFRELARLALKSPALTQQALMGATDPGAPQKFTLNAFRRHYLVIQGSKPQIFDDWTLSGSAVIGLEDLSMQLVPQVQWMPKEWLQLTLAIYVPVSGLASEGVTVGGTSYGQFTLSPFQTRVLFQARAFF